MSDRAAMARDRSSTTPALAAGGSPDRALRAADPAASRLQRTAGNAALAALVSEEVPEGVRSVMASGGRPLDPGLRTEMEERFGENFEDVRIHVGRAASDAAADLEAKAYTIGRDIVFSDGRFAPETAAGRRLLAHELAHVVQQRRGGAAPPLSDRAPHEDGAHRAAESAAAGGGPVSVGGGTGVGIARAPEDDDKKKKKKPRTGGLYPKVRTDLTDDERRDLERKRDVFEEFEDRAHDPDPRAELEDERLRNRSGRSERARHRTRDKGKRKDWEKQRGKQRDTNVDEHHAYPKFLGGNKDQTYVKLPKLLHELYHKQLYDLLDKELKGREEAFGKLGIQPQDLRGASRRSYGKLFAMLPPEEREKILDKVIKQAEKFDDDHRHEYRDRRQRLAAGVRRGIKEAKKEEKAEKKASKPPTSAGQPPPATSGKGRGSAKKATPGKAAAAKTSADAKSKAAAKKGRGQAAAGAKTDKEKARAKQGKPAAQADATKGGLKPPGTGVKTKPSRAAKPSTGATKATTPPGPAAKRQRPPAARPAAKKSAGTTAPVTTEQQTTPAPKPPAPKPAEPKPKQTAQQATGQTPPAQQPPAQKPPAQQAPAQKPPEKPPQKPPARKAPVQQSHTGGAATTVVAPPGPTTVKTQGQGGPATTKQPPPSRVPSKKTQPVGKSTPAPSGPDASSVDVQGTGRMIAGPGQAGFTGGGTAVASQSHGKGISTSQSLHFGGKVSTTVTEVPGSNPPRFRVTLHINLGGRAGVGVAREGRVGGSLSGGVSGSLSAAFSHVLSAEEAEKYVGAAQAGSGGAYRELKIVQLVAANSLEEAKAYLTEMKASMGSPDAAKRMTEGDEVTFEAEKGVDASAGVSGGRRSRVGVELGASRSGRVQRSKAYRDGKVIVTVAVAGDTGTSVGGSFSQGAAGMGYGQQNTKSKGMSVSFVLDPKAPSFDADWNAIHSVESIEELGALAGRRPELLGSTTTSRGKSKTGTTTANVGPVAIGFSDVSEYDEEETTDERGVTRQYRGSGGGGATLSAGGVPLASGSKVDTIRAVVGPGGKGGGEAVTTSRETDYGKSVQAVAASMEKNPLGTLGGLVTGSTPVLQERSDTEGKAMTDDSYSVLAELSKDPVKWEKKWSGDVDTLLAWRALRPKIEAAHGDRDQIARLMGEFGKGGRRAATVGNAIGDTGIAFAFPDELSEFKPAYDRLVVGDPVADARTLAGQGRGPEAIAQLEGAHNELGNMLHKLQEKQGKTNNEANLAAMMNHINSRRAALRAEIRKLSPAPKPVGLDFVGPVSPAQKEEAAKQARQAEIDEQNRKRAERNARVDELVPALLTNREREEALFAAVAAEQKAWFPSAVTIAQTLTRIKNMWAAWDVTVNELRAIFQERGEGGERADAYGPDKSRWERVNGKFIGEAG